MDARDEDQDDSLTNFFAKKDKSSKKKGKSGKSKIVVSDLLPSSSPTPPNEPTDNVEVLSEKLLETKVDNSNVNVNVETQAQVNKEKDKERRRKKKDKEGSEANSKNEDDEWNEVKDEVDYSGLRIATKNIAKEAAEEAAESARLEPEYDEDGQIIEKSDGKVWKLKEVKNEPEPEPVAPAPAPIITEMPNVTGGRYIPPGQRGGGGSSDLAPISLKKPGGWRKKQAPNMNSQEDFPTLGAAPPPVDYDVAKFERVRGGGSSQQSSSHAGPSRLETSNMYSALDRR